MKLFKDRRKFCIYIKALEYVPRGLEQDFPWATRSALVVSQRIFPSNERWLIVQQVKERALALALASINLTQARVI